MSRSFSVSLDPAALIEAAGGLERFGSNVGEVIQEAVNERAAKFLVQARKRMIAQIALDEGYVASKMRLEPSSNPNAIQVSLLTAGDLVVLGHYSPKVLYKPATAVRKSRKFKGDASRGVPAGQKAAGVQVTIKPGQPKVFGNGFTLKLRRGTELGDTVGVFTRDQSKKLHRYGVAPYSLFRYQVEQTSGDFLGELEVDVSDAIVNRYGIEVSV